MVMIYNNDDFINCIDSKIPFDPNKRPFFLFHGKPEYMINYHYIWYKYKGGAIMVEENKQILDIIFASKFEFILIISILIIV